MLDDSRVRVSVVIPARDAEAMIGRTVAAARAQELDGPFEVIVVDDGSTDDTARVAADAGARVVSNGEPAGPADARNAGVAASTAPLIAFTDADCVPAPGWLRAGVDALDGSDLVQGRVEPEPDVPVGPFDHVITVREETGLYETANLFVRREWFDRVGGFKPFIDPARGTSARTSSSAGRCGAQAGARRSPPAPSCTTRSSSARRRRGSASAGACSCSPPRRARSRS